MIDGVALQIDHASVRLVAEEDNSRWTWSYTNVRDGGAGLTLRVWRPMGGYDNVATNISMDAREAREVAIAYVLYGTVPTNKGWF